MTVSGHVENDTWTGKDGVTHYDLRLGVQALRLKARRDARSAAEPKGADLECSASELDDEIPF